MSSLVIKNQKTIVLFQGGLGDRGEGFEETIDLLSKKSSNMIKSNIFIDMKNFDINKNTFFGTDSSGYLSKQDNLVIEFNKKIANIVSLANNNLDKSILVRTSLSESIDSISNHEIIYFGFDSIRDQAAKLIYIINAIKDIDNSVRIILVGHSQGGLVNLEAATRIPNKIEKMISISTPYSPVYMAQKLIHINFIASIFNTDLFALLEEKPKMAQKYKDRVDDLSNASLFDDIKGRWNNLSKRPQLTIITGVSGHLVSFFPGTGIFSPSLSKYSFDGLVTIEEQTAIDYASIVGLTNPKIACYTTKKYMEKRCYFKQAFSSSCNKDCCLPSFDLDNTIISTLIETIVSFVASLVRGKSFDLDINNLSVVNDIMNGVNGKPISNPDNQKYYDVYRSDYSHQNLRYCDETIGKLIALFSA